uniref:Uncharacterized protein n=1 Tax=Arundo donax TaxID=35708 RepID=A0A0A8YKI0_ARUDO
MNEGQEAQMNPVGGSGVGVGVGGAGGTPQHQPIQDISDLIAGMDHQFEMLRIEQPMQDMPGLAGMDKQFEMLRTSMREKIYEYIGRKQMTVEWRRQLPKLAMRLEEVLFSKFLNKNDYYDMMKGPLEPQLQFAIRIMSAQNQQNYQNRQMSRQLAPTSGYGTIIPTASMTLGTTGDTRVPYVSDKNALSSSVPGMVPYDAGMRTSMLGAYNFT